MPFESFELQEGDEGSEFHNAYIDFIQQNNNFDDTFMERKKAKRKKKQPDLNEFLGDDNVELDK